MSANGLFGPGIFGTGIDVSALDEDTALRLGQFFGEQIREAETRGYQRAIKALRDSARVARSSVDRAAMKLSADFLEER